MSRVVHQLNQQRNCAPLNSRFGFFPGLTVWITRLAPVVTFFNPANLEKISRFLTGSHSLYPLGCNFHRLSITNYLVGYQSTGPSTGIYANAKKLGHFASSQ